MRLRSLDPAHADQLYTQTYLIPSNIAKQSLPDSFPSEWIDAGNNVTSADYAFDTTAIDQSAGASQLIESFRALPNVMLTIGLDLGEVPHDR